MFIRVYPWLNYLFQSLLETRRGPVESLNRNATGADPHIHVVRWRLHLANQTFANHAMVPRVFDVGIDRAQPRFRIDRVLLRIAQLNEDIPGAIRRVDIAAHIRNHHIADMVMDREARICLHIPKIAGRTLNRIIEKA